MKRGQNEDLRKANTIDWSERWGVGGDGLLDESLLARASNFLNYETKFGYKGCFVFIPHSLRGKILTNIDADDPRVSFPFAVIQCSLLMLIMSILEDSKVQVLPLAQLRMLKG